MKILQIINSLDTGGAEKLLLETIPIYIEKGVEMDILVLNGKDYPFMTELKELNCCKIYSLGFQSVYNPIHIFKIIPYLKKYDLIHVHLFPAQYWVVLAKLVSFSKSKLIFTEHNTSNRRLESQLFSLIDKHFYRFYTAVICITTEIKELLLNHTRLPLTRLHLIENGVNLINIINAKALKKEDINVSLKHTDKIIIQVSSFRPQKDQATLIRAMKLLPDNIKLFLIGDGLLRNDCEALVMKLYLQKRVLFLGLRIDVPQLLKTSDIVVLSSKYEGLSLSSIEGMASGKPFVASDVPGLSEIVKNAGVLFECGDVKELADIIKELLDNPKYYSDVVLSCQAKAVGYGINRMIDSHILLYKSLLE